MCQRRVSRLIASLILVMALGNTPARANDPAVVQLVGMFITLCLERFPNDDAVRQFATERGLAVMPEERLRRMLGKDPGVGWLHNTPRGQYVLTVEFPPYHTCAVRKAETETPDFLGPLSQVLGRWAEAQSATLKPLPVQETTIGGFPSQMHRWELDRGQGKRPEALMAIVSKTPEVVEVRLARAIDER